MYRLKSTTIDELVENLHLAALSGAEATLGKEAVTALAAHIGELEAELTTLRAQIKQAAEQEPFGYLLDWPSPTGRRDPIFSTCRKAGEAIGLNEEHIHALYTDPKPAPVTAPKLIDLSNLKDRLLAPRKLARDENGMLCHPALPVIDESVSTEDFLAVFGIECRAVAMESDNPDLHDLAYEDISVTKAWRPTPPAGDNWVLTDIYDTEDGPHALFLRDAAHAAHSPTEKES